MKTIDNLKQGDKIYDYDNYQVQWYTYFCIHPNNKKYHILINQCQDPIRVYEKDLQSKLNKNLLSWDDAALGLANHLENRAKSLREK